MKLLTLTSIILLDRPDHQTRTFYGRVQTWMSQWTIPNNFKPIAVESTIPGSPWEDANDHAALEIWAKKFEASFNSAIPEAMPADGNLRSNFAFIYYEDDLVAGQEIGPRSTCQIELNNIRSL